MNLGKIKSWIETKFLFVVRKEEDFSVITSFSISKKRIGLLLILFFMVSFVISLFLARTLLNKWFDPAFQETENTAKIYALSETVDSLLTEVKAKDHYLNNIKRIIAGENPGEEEVSSPESVEPLAGNREIDLYKSGEATKSIIAEFETVNIEELNLGRVSRTSFIDTYFFPPVKGVVTSPFSPTSNHLGIDVVATDNEPVKAIADGTVVLASWTLETGYVISIQHSNELISIYKHNSVLLKSIGDVVSGGEIISIIGNTGEQSTGQHLHLELWYKGNPLNPQEFITFN
ncbi:M23 family metallopeptidase [Pararhodonellum marinum]|uniref:M23 family metallopeptidase n=1 Tax=Pararhodonellum marinum TaxID=2755358 RepID=UPI00188E9699|nr:M23 family metallopeptidase [Pararhodonellum marinum]